MSKIVAGLPIKEWRHNYYLQHREYYQEYQKNNYYLDIEKSRQKKRNYYENNKEAIQERQKIYCKNNAERLREYAKKMSMKHYNISKRECECGKLVAKKNYESHLLTNLHAKNLRELTLTNGMKLFTPN